MSPQASDSITIPKNKALIVGVIVVVLIVLFFVSRRKSGDGAADSGMKPRRRQRAAGKRGGEAPASDASVDPVSEELIREINAFA